MDTREGWFTNAWVIPEESQPDRGLFTLYIKPIDQTITVDVQREQVISPVGNVLKIRKVSGQTTRVVSVWGRRNGKRAGWTVAIDGWFQRLRINPLNDIPVTDKADLTPLGYLRLTLCRDGQLWSQRSWSWLEPFLSNDTWCYRIRPNWAGYLRERRCRPVPIHHLLARAFIPNPNGYSYVRFKDGDSWNIELNNLEWSDTRQNRSRGRWTNFRHQLLKS